MSSQKCPSCGLVNWSDAPECKRCRAPIQPGEEGYAFRQPIVFEEEKPATVLGVLMIIWGALLLIGGLYLLTFGHASHVLVFGPATLISGVSVARGRQSMMGLYFLGIVVMLLWAGSQGKVGVALSGSLFGAIIGLLVIKRRLPILAGFLIVLSCLGTLGALAIPILLKPGNVAWRDFRPPEGMFSVQMPAEPVARDWGVEQLANGYRMKKSSYEARVRGQGSALFFVVEYLPSLPPVADTSVYEKALEAELNNILNNTKSTLRSKEKIKVNGYYGLSYQLNPPENLAMDRPVSTGKIFMNAGHLYVMQLTASESSELLAGKDRFLTPSFLSSSQAGITNTPY